MSKINRWLLGFFLAVVWPSTLILFADEFSSEDASPQNSVSSAFEEATSGIDGAIVAAQHQVRDPFSSPDFSNAPAVAAAPSGPAITPELQGIGVGGKEAYAVIGGDVFYKGDEKNGIKLLEVRKQEVDILLNGEKLTVSLFPEKDLKKARERAEKMSLSLSRREQSPL